LCFKVNIQAQKTTHTFYGAEAQDCYTQFLKHYSKQHKEEILKQIQSHGSQLHMLKAMLYVHCMQSIEPESIQKFLQNYNHSKYSREWKRLFIYMLSEIPASEQHQIFKAIVATDKQGTIQQLEFHARNKDHGVLIVNGMYFYKKVMTLQMFSHKKRGGMR
jgi:hypothetical protein